MIDYKKVSTDKHCEWVEDLASIIWIEHYTPIIGIKQVHYMLDKFQSKKAIQKQITDSYEYYFVQFDKLNIGYLSFKKEGVNLFLSKLYLLESHRSKGLGKSAMSFIEAKAKTLHCKHIYLTVNKYNTHTINIYKRLGFSILEGIVIDIGDGFIMDDYKMEKTVT